MEDLLLDFLFEDLSVDVSIAAVDLNIDFEADGVFDQQMGVLDLDNNFVSDYNPMFLDFDSDGFLDQFDSINDIDGDFTNDAIDPLIDVNNNYINDTEDPFQDWDKDGLSDGGYLQYRKLLTDAIANLGVHTYE